ncbi:MAG TPA: zinc-dependent alcohol dehydrogenase family protein [Acidobacteriota bacterium]|nr:zinc-dependent alcohol dehydrogenase family protein [Acidobacteriota bacterium]HQG92180.1 zinc-dependent alcohol dehydrogenase family protein [Acidobacteriota bacterium]
MRAMRLHESAPIEERPLRLEDVPVPKPGPGEIRIRVAACGVCHTDLHEAEGDLALPIRPITTGHQIVGVVDAVGPGALRFRPGDRVGVPWLGRTCGACRFCAAGRENLCPDAVFTGFHRDGGYADYAVAAEAFACPLPPGVSDTQAAPLLCAGIIGYRALRLSRVRPGEALGLFGFGASAHVAIQIARHWRCRVYVFTRSEAHRELARRQGAEWVGAATEAPPEPLTGGIVFAPAGEIVPRALEHLDRGGTLALAGIWMSDTPPLDYARHLYFEKTLCSVTASTRADAEELMALAPVVPIHTDVQTFPLAAANEALADLKHSRLRHGAAVLTVAPAEADPR